ncbi:MAG: FAD/FMN-containing dehydrogenase [Candidatus Azotimanducaceae bacterium]|jgi:FAD/FMN-containing dehydrogenase
MTLVERLKNIVGESRVKTDRADLEHYGLDWTRFYDPKPIAIVFVRTTGEAVALVNLAREAGIPLVPSGGRTGLSGAACATAGEIVVSFEQMNQVLEFDAASSSVRVQPGIVTKELQAFAQERGLLYPVDFASSGSSQLGGNISTNAGGIRVIRYGMTRDQITGLKVVTGRGDVLDLNKGLAKNNTGYDFRHLFIGAEGTLGLIVEATVQLLPAPEASVVILLAVPKIEGCLMILESFKRAVTINAFEFFSDPALRQVLLQSDLTSPFEVASPYYVLIEYESAGSTDMDKALAAFERCVEDGVVTDGIIASSGEQSEALWQYRERISESITPRTPYKNDISVKISRIPAFLEEIDALVQQRYPSFEVIWFGHVGDGNLHLNILKPEGWETGRFKAECERVSHEVLGLVERYEGSISAEHGVGLLKKDHLGFTRSVAEIEAMRAIKFAFDPDGIMNPGKVF